MTIRTLTQCVLLMALGLWPCGVVAMGPEPGDLYREFAKHNGGNRDWRVTDKEAVKKFDAAKEHLPNARLEIQIDDLQHAVRAEALFDRWGGHRGTINKRIRFNDNAWINVPEIESVPAGIRAEQLMYQDNPIVAIPLQDLREGVNIFDADCDEQGGFGWGQWGLYSLVVRIYYDPVKKGEKQRMSGRITSPAPGAALGENPTVQIQADATMGVSRIDVLASYDGYDEDGDGVYDGYHESHFQLVSGQPNELRDHVGTLWQQPYQTTWDTHWVPDQRPGAVALVARIQDSRGYWTVTEPVTGLSLVRPDVSVKLYRAEDVPEDFSVRADETQSCTFTIPSTDPIASASEAILHLRTWHGWDGHHDPIRINNHELAIGGKNHFYDYDRLPLPVESLKSGTNTFAMHSTTEHHMLEVLWPGPAIAVRMPRPAVSIQQDLYQQRDHFVVNTPAATYWLDQRSGGLSRLIDLDGNDWIAFKKKPWDQYPASAAAAFRGMPNLLFGGDESGFGHPGWDRGQSRQIDERTILSTSDSGQWRLRWTFSDQHVDLTVETDVAQRKFWFLYEGPVAGRWAPDQQYFATDSLSPVTQPRDYMAGERIEGHFRWVYLGDSSVARVLAIAHRTADQQRDTFSHLGASDQGLDADDGMVVLGFGRGPKGIDPLLTGAQSFRIGLIESAGSSMTEYESIGKQLEPWAVPAASDATPRPLD
ncbi:hypothetical protein NHH03_10025 [Stieleria sp. TO1_6]|uniref:hypothetical protein n=1 Tax=Stieleria tagensis TaxID=2956795 RepID=UPI00209AEE40|nr:hypothetical protein [Stieleria tagensis]MCO8122075.1 hypothetical protein [Stieleria tagensis]